MSPIEWVSFSINIVVMVTALSCALFSEPTLSHRPSSHRSLTDHLRRVVRLIGLFSLSTIALYLILLVAISALIGI